MIGSAIFQLIAGNSGKLDATQGRLLHAAFFQILNSYSVELAACTHDNVRFKAFTVSELMPVKEKKRKFNTVFVRKGDVFYWRVTVLNDELLRAIASVPVGYVLNVGSIHMTVKKIVMDSDKDKMTGVLDVTHLMAACLSVNMVKKITFHFVSPVSFRTFKDDYPFPLPQLIFGSLAEKWNLAEMPVEFDCEEVRAVAAQLLPIAWKGSTITIFLKKDRGITGFTGDFSFKTDMLPVEKQQMLLLLAQFAFFSGVGRLTGQGMGQTRVTYQ